MNKKILIIYATNSGGTQESSILIENVFKKDGFEVAVKKITEANPEDIGVFDLIIFGSPSWDYKGKEGQVHEDYLPFFEKMKGKTYPDKKFAVFGLGDSSYTYFAGSSIFLDKFVESLKGQKIGTTLKIDGFYFNELQNSEKVEDWAQSLVDILNK